MHQLHRNRALAMSLSLQNRVGALTIRRSLPQSLFILKSFFFSSLPAGSQSKKKPNPTVFLVITKFCRHLTISFLRVSRSPCWPWTPDLPSPTSQVLTSQVCSTTTPDFFLLGLCFDFTVLILVSLLCLSSYSNSISLAFVIQSPLACFTCLWSCHLSIWEASFFLTNKKM